MPYWLWLIIGSLVAMVWAMLRYHVEPMIILALLVCVSLLAIAVMFVADASNDDAKVRIAQLEMSVEKVESKLELHEKRIRRVETL